MVDSNAERVEGIRQLLTAERTPSSRGVPWSGPAGLFAYQASATCVVTVLHRMWLGGAWGAWLPALGWFIGTYVYATRSRQPGLALRETRKELSWRTGALAGAAAALGYAVLCAWGLGPDGINSASGAALSVLVGCGMGVVATMITLMGLDAAGSQG